MILPQLTYRHFVLTLLVGLVISIHLFAPKAAFELDLVFALAAVMAPSVKRLGERLGGHRGLAVLLVSLCILIAVVLISIFVVPPAARSLRDMLVGLKDQIPALRQILEDWIAGLGEYTAGFDLDEGLQKILDILQKEGTSGAIMSMAGKISFGVVFGIAQTLVGCVILAILAASWDQFVAWSKKLIGDLAPAQSTRVVRIAENAQKNGIAMVRGLGFMALIFTLSYTVILIAIGMPLGKIIVFSLVLGLFSSLPAVGGFVSATLSILIALAHFGLWGWQGWVLVGAGIAAHFVETKFLTPRIVGQAIDVPPFVMIASLLSGVALNGGAGVFQALMLLPILRALVDDIAHSPPPARGLERGQGPALADPPLTVVNHPPKPQPQRQQSARKKNRR